MPKDATKNIDRYKIRGGHLNEFEYTERQKTLAEKKPQGGGKRIPGTPPEEAADDPPFAVKAKASNATKSTKSTKSTKKKATNISKKGATAKKLAARKAAAKK